MSNRHIVGAFAIIFLLQVSRFSPAELAFVQVKDDYLVAQNREDIVSRHFNEQLDSGGEIIYAPLIIGAGQGTTGTHLFVDATCAMGFVSLHYGIGCLPKHVLNISDDILHSRYIGSDLKAKAPLQLLPKYAHYRELLQYHSRISSGFLKTFKSNKTLPVEVKDNILNDLEEIITWGKRHRVVLALHDTPYPMLMPEMTKLVQKHYRSNIGQVTKPIILLSERDPEEYVQRRLQSHGSYSWICRPPDGNAKTINKIDSTTFEGGAFDFTRCINSAPSSRLTMNQIFYTMHQAVKLNQRQFIVDSFKNYQDTVREAAIFVYNMFDRENKTSTDELAEMIAKSMNEYLYNDMKQLRFNEGADFVGFEKLAAGEDFDFDRNTRTLVDILVFKNQVVISRH